MVRKSLLCAVIHLMCAHRTHKFVCSSFFLCSCISSSLFNVCPVCIKNGEYMCVCVYVCV